MGQAPPEVSCLRAVKRSRIGGECHESISIQEGHVRINGKRVLKPAEEVREGQVIALPLRGAVRVLRVLGLPTRRGPPTEARCHYEEVGPTPPNPSGD